MRDLHIGDSGDEVRLLQHLLNTRLVPSPRLPLSGRFRERTDAAVREFQRRSGLRVDGIVGARTRAALGVWPSGFEGVPVRRVEQAARAGAAVRVESATPAPTPAPAAPAAPAGAARGPVPPAGAGPSPNANAPAARTGAPATAAAGAPAPLELHQTVTPSTTVMSWMRIAEAEEGVSEIVGPRGHNPRIVEYHASTSLSADDDETPWCSSFVNWVLVQDCKRGTNSAAARSWVRWGVETSSPPIGAVCVIRRRAGGFESATGSHSGNHVGFFVSLNADRTSIQLLGGNQSNSVRYSNFNMARYRILAFRVPG
jgi:uncharacterized protein (TIGR02594 family)